MQCVLACVIPFGARRFNFTFENCEDLHCSAIMLQDTEPSLLPQFENPPSLILASLKSQYAFQCMGTFNARRCSFFFSLFCRRWRGGWGNGRLFLNWWRVLKSKKRRYTVNLFCSLVGYQDCPSLCWSLKGAVRSLGIYPNADSEFALIPTYLLMTKQNLLLVQPGNNDASTPLGIWSMPPSALAFHCKNKKLVYQWYHHHHHHKKIGYKKF